MVNTDPDPRPPGSLALLARLWKMVYRRSSEELLGMTLRHFVSLSYLRDHPNAPQQDLGDVFCVDASNLVLLLNELECADLAQRRRDPGDRRRHLVGLTPTGAAALDRAERAQEQIEEEIFHTLSTAERATLRSLMARALADVERSSGLAGVGPSSSLADLKPSSDQASRAGPAEAAPGAAVAAGGSVAAVTG